MATNNPAEDASSQLTKCPAMTPSLDHDILRVVFTLNADMFAPDEDSFRTTFWSSHVCRSWRDVIVHDALVWAGLVDLDVLLRIKLSGVREVVKRSRGLPVCIKASKLSDSSLKRAARILDPLWRRVEKVVVGRTTLNAWASPVGGRLELYGDSRLLWDIFSRPAPLLKHFDVDLRWAGNANVNVHPSLFNNDAPMISHFNAAHYTNRIPEGSAWFSNLSSVTLAFPYKKFDELADALKKLPSLKRLSIQDDAGHSCKHSLSNVFAFTQDGVICDLCIRLAGLQELHLKAGAKNLALFFKCQFVPLNCAFHYTNVPDNTFDNVYEFIMDELADFAQKAFERAHPTCMALRWGETQYEILFTSDRDRGLEIKTKWPPIAFTYLPASGDTPFTLHILLPKLKACAGLLNHFSSDSLTSITLIKISLRGPIPNLHCLWSMQAVEVIQADLPSLNLLARRLLRNASDIPELLPRLNTIRVVEDLTHRDLEVAFLVHLLQIREREKVPVKTIDLTELDVSFRLALAALFRGVECLEVLY
ncbi:hypothetical protein CVT26_001049 [Gymnopilus dilepis]|uniref:F-box domain-containing protein n=1 Tax=Gymnopilus dilepis TaxID=231916 RepID=A0A409YLQ8_9AGAR|nr:hypothetical protein CVT26_001049 [Gymnopilus dilepis]